MNSIRRGICLVLGEQYGLDISEAAECLQMVGWNTEAFRVIADDCMWGINPNIFRSKLRASTVLLRYLVAEWGNPIGVFHRHG